METAATARPPALTAPIILLAAAMLAVVGARPAHAQSNAAPLWREAFRAAGYGTANPLLSAEDVNFMIDATARGTALGPVERARMADLMERTADVRRQFAAAARVPRSDWDLDRSRGFALELPHLGSMRSAARLLQAQARWELDEGRRDQALEAVAALAGMGAQPGQDDIVVSSMVGQAIASQFVEVTDEAIDRGAVGKDAAQALLEAAGALKGDDPHAFAQAVLGEGGMLRATIEGARSDAELRRLFGEAAPEMATGGITLEGARGEVGGIAAFHERAARAFANPDPAAAEAEINRLEQQAKAGRFGALMKVVAPDLASVLRAKVAGQRDMARLLAALQAIADGKANPDDLRNAAHFLARAAAAARAQPQDIQETIELLRVAPEAAQGDALARAAIALDRARDDAVARLADAAACRRCDFAALRGRVPSLEIALLGGIRGATRMALADGLRTARAAGSPAAIAPAAAIAFRTAALLASDPTLARAAVAQRIWREAVAALADASRLGPLAAADAERIEIAARTMPSADPFGFRAGFERDIEAVANGWNVVPSRSERERARSRSDAPKRDDGQPAADRAGEGPDPRAKVLRQRGATPLLGYVSWLSAIEAESLPAADDPPLVSLSDLWPADAVAAANAGAEAWRALPEDRRPPARAEIPGNLAEDEQRARMKAFDPSRVDDSSAKTPAPLFTYTRICSCVPCVE